MAAGPPDLLPTAGLRSLACLCIVATHTVYYVGRAAQDKRAAYSMITQHRWLNLALHISEPAMDTFLVLTGCHSAPPPLPLVNPVATAEGDHERCALYT